MSREVVFFGVSRTIPAVERKDLSKFAIQSVHFSPSECCNLDIDVAKCITRILGKDVSQYTVIKPDKYGNITLLSGKTDKGKSYSEFHFGAGESSIIKMIMGIEAVEPQSLVLIEEIENGLHPLVVRRLVEYLIDTANRKKIQVIFTTHSEYAIDVLPGNAIWASLNGEAVQGKLTIESLKTFTGDTKAHLVIYVEDEFAKAWVLQMLRNAQGIELDGIEIYALHGESAAVNANKYHNQDPSNHINSICILDGDADARYVENEQELIYRLPGETPETYIFNNILDILDRCSAKIAIRCNLGYKDSIKVEDALQKVSMTNLDHHTLFSQIGERLLFINENVVRGAFLSTWCEEYPDEVEKFLNKIKEKLPKNNESYIEGK